MLYAFKSDRWHGILYDLNVYKITMSRFVTGCMVKCLSEDNNVFLRGQWSIPEVTMKINEEVKFQYLPQYLYPITIVMVFFM